MLKDFFALPTRAQIAWVAAITATLTIVLLNLLIYGLEYFGRFN